MKHRFYRRISLLVVGVVASVMPTGPVASASGGQSVINLPTVPTQWRIAGVGDFLGKGQSDLVWENTATGQRGIWIMTNGVWNSAINLPTMPTQWHFAGVGDFLGNRQSDLVWENTVTGQRGIWIMTNGVWNSVINLPTVPTQWHIVEH